MKKLQKMTNEQLRHVLLKDLYGYRQDWYERYLKNHSDTAWKEFSKAKTLIKEIENWEDQSEENWKTLRKGINTYMDFVMITKTKGLSI